MSNELIERLTDALNTRDAEVATCPIQKGFQDVCPRCRATASQMCGVIAGADYALVEAVRTALSHPSTAIAERSA